MALEAVSKGDCQDCILRRVAEFVSISATVVRHEEVGATGAVGDSEAVDEKEAEEVDAIEMDIRHSNDHGSVLPALNSSRSVRGDHDHGRGMPADGGSPELPMNGYILAGCHNGANGVDS